MRFAVDAHAIGRKLTGNEVYVRSLLNAFATLDRDSEFIAYIAAEEAREWVPARFETKSVSANPFVRLGYDLSRRALHDRAALLHVQYTAPLYCTVPVVASVHDVSFLEHPEYFTAARSWQLRSTVPRTMRHAACVITGSEFSRERISALCGIPAEKVVVIPYAASKDFRPIAREAAASVVRDRFGIRAPFFLTVGDLHPRKNHVALVRAFASLLRRHPRLPHHLVLAGKDTWYAPRVREAIADSGCADRIHTTGFVSDSDLLSFYNACDAFVFPSLYEGFGLPAVEAMACGRAVACSNTSSLPEVVDGAALLFDPLRPDEMARALADLALDSELRLRMERLALQRAAAFSWSRTAEQTLEVYRAVAGAGGVRLAQRAASVRS